MSDHASKPVSLELTELQKLRLQLAQRECDLNAVMQWDSTAKIALFRIWRLISNAQYPNLPEHLRAEADSIGSEMEEILANLEREGEQLRQRFFATGEAIKKENDWPEHIRWNTSTLEFSAAQSNESQFIQ